MTKSEKASAASIAVALSALPLLFPPLVVPMFVAWVVAVLVFLTWSLIKRVRGGSTNAMSDERFLQFEPSIKLKNLRLVRHVVGFVAVISALIPIAWPATPFLIAIWFLMFALNRRTERVERATWEAKNDGLRQS